MCKRNCRRLLDIGEAMRRQLQVALLCSLALWACDSTENPEAVVGSYRWTGAPAFTLSLRADGTVLEKIGGREVVGRWMLWINRERAYGGPRSRIELTGVVLHASEPQTNNSMYAHVQRWPRKLVLDLEDGKKLELRREGTP